MDRRDFLKTNVSGSFALGLMSGAAAATAAGLGLYQVSKRLPEKFSQVSFAQQGEDLVLWQIVRDTLEIENITYLDIGANEPIRYNNTYFFYERGLRGVLVEPNQSLWEKLEVVRPGDKLLRAGIGAGGRSTADFYVLEGPGTSGVHNTFSKADAEEYVRRSQGRYSIKEVIKMPLLDINEVMAEHFKGAPNVLSVDAEGFELRILKSIDFRRFRPDAICVETLVYGTRRVRPETLEFMASRGYEPRGGSFVNTVFMDRRHIA